jgi:hypothetical protein
LLDCAPRAGYPARRQLGTSTPNGARSALARLVPLPARAEGGGRRSGRVVRQRRDTDLEDLEARLERYREWCDKFYRPGTLNGDFNRFLNAIDEVPVPHWLGGWEPLDPWRAAKALARHRRFLSSGFKNPRVARCLGRLVSRHGRARVECILRTDIFPQALIFAARDTERRRRIKLGRRARTSSGERVGPRYLRDAANRVGAFSPADLPVVAEFYDWLSLEAHRIAETLVADRVGESPRPCREQPVGDELERFLAAAGTPATREVSRYLAPTKGGDPDRDLRAFSMRAEGHTSAEIGQALGMKAATVRQRLSRMDRRRVAR